MDSPKSFLRFGPIWHKFLIDEFLIKKRVSYKIAKTWWGDNEWIGPIHNPLLIHYTAVPQYFYLKASENMIK